MNFFRFFLIFNFCFFFFFSRSFWVTDRNDSQNTAHRFLDKRYLRKLESLRKFEEIYKSILAKKKVTLLFFFLIIFTNLLITFWNYWYVKSMFSAPSKW